MRFTIKYSQKIFILWKNFPLQLLHHINSNLDVSSLSLLNYFSDKWCERWNLLLTPIEWTTNNKTMAYSLIFRKKKKYFRIPVTIVHFFSFLFNIFIYNAEKNVLSVERLTVDFLLSLKHFLFREINNNIISVHRWWIEHVNRQIWIWYGESANWTLTEIK